MEGKCNIDEKIVREVCAAFGVTALQIKDPIDTSHGEDDIRLNFIIDDAYVLKITNGKTTSEDFLSGVSRLIKRYHVLDIWAPHFLMTSERTFLYTIEFGGRIFRCYMEEFSIYPTDLADRYEMYTVKKRMLGHLGRVATAYTGVDLVPVFSMWTLIDLAPTDTDVDEKQENLDMLKKACQDKGFEKETALLENTNIYAREQIKKYYKELPRCVFQGDLNPSNILLDEEGNFKGLIDFNMYGTEVNINCFLNECMYYMEENDIKDHSPDYIYQKMNQMQEEMMSEVLQNYSLNKLERKCIPFYKRVIDISFYPNVMLMIRFLEVPEQQEKVLKLIRLLCGGTELDEARITETPKED